MGKNFLLSAFIMIAITLIIPHTASAFALPDTGQTKCYQGVSPYAEIPCAGTGQDGEYNINPMSYIDNGNGTVTDRVTGLMWQKCSAGQNNDSTCSGTASTRTWADALAYCSNLRLGGYSDWRLPSDMELMSIVDYGVPYPGPTIKATFFPNTAQSFYWSSTVYAGTTFSVWGVSFDYGYVLYSSRAGSNYIRCVRDGQ